MPPRRAAPKLALRPMARNKFHSRQIAQIFCVSLHRLFDAKFNSLTSKQKASSVGAIRVQDGARLVRI